jgi:hypothetical protein
MIKKGHVGGACWRPLSGPCLTESFAMESAASHPTVRGASRRPLHEHFLLICLAIAWPAFAAAPVSPPAPEAASRVFFSDAKLSLAVPDDWDVDPSFPFGPVFQRTTPEGSQALITCQISDPLAQTHLATNLPADQLRKIAEQNLAAQNTHARILSRDTRQIAGHDAFEMTWEEQTDSTMTQVQSVYFFSEDRVYAVALRARADSFPWLVPPFQEWLNTVEMLTAKDSGVLQTPAHGGLWVHQTGGAKIAIPDAWLIGVADDRSLGATLANGSQHSELTASVATVQQEPQMTPEEHDAARAALEKKGYRILSETDEPFHGLSALQFNYEGNRSDGRVVRGTDVWVATPKGHWLFSVEGDITFFNHLTSDFNDILNNIQFL